MKIDVNSDMGEGFGVYQLCDDAALMKVVSSANIACGFHAGDPAIMTRMVQLAKAHGVAIGAHPGLPDRQGFGRRELPFTPEEICQQVAYQLGALTGIAQAEGAKVVHFSFHAAMGNIVNRDAALAQQVMARVARINPRLIVFAQPDTIIERAAQAAGLPTLTLFLADRAYDAQGRLVPRGLPGSVIKEESALRARVRQFLQRGTVTTIEGEEIAVRARSILIHSDTPGSLALATLVRHEVEACGHQVASAADVLAQ